MNTCYHCGSKIYGSEILGLDNKSFCCNACLAVAELISNSELNLYYQLRENSSPEKVKTIPSELYLAYDVEEVANQYLRKIDDNFCEANLFIDGIHCSACGWLIKKALKNKLNLEEVSINTTTSRAEIIYPAKKIKLSEILQTISALGYQPNLFNPAQEELNYNKIRNSYLSRILVSGLGMMQVMMFATGLYTGAFFGIERDYSQLLRWVSLILTTPIFLYTGYPFLKSAYLGLKNRQINMDIPIATALFFSFIASVLNTFLERGEIYFDSVLMFIFFITISRFLEFLTRRRAKLNSLNFSKLLPESLEVLDKNKTLKFIPLPAIQKGEIVKILPSQTIAFDGIVVEGETRIDEAMLTGEQMPLFKKVGDKVLAGSQNLESPIFIKVQTTGQEPTLAGIERLISQAQKSQSQLYLKSQKLAEKTILAILILAALGWISWQFINPNKAFDIALAVLVATCPCALSLAIPVVLTTAINKAHSLGIFIKSSEALDKLLSIRNLIFDKTGTLTEGNFRLISANFYNQDKNFLWQIAKSLEKNSPHPLAWAIVKECSLEELKMQKIKLFNQGVIGEYQGIKYGIGSYNFLKEEFLLTEEIKESQENSEIFLVSPKTILAKFIFADPEIKNLAQLIKQLNNYKILIASGDKLKNVAKIANKIGIKEFYGELKPEDKLKILENLEGDSLVIGDGINDAPLMKKAFLSVSVKGANILNQESADIVLLKTGVETLPYLFALAKKCQNIIKLNLIWASAYNILIIPLALLGFLTPWIAALGMSLSSLIVVGNALRVKSEDL